MAEFEAQGIQVFALSYDEPEALRDFADEFNITYTLLSDPKSKVIKQYGILNTLIPEDDHPWVGIPFPGTYVTNGNAEITHKFFESNLAVRVGPEQLLKAALGKFQQHELEVTSQHDAVNHALDSAPRIYLEGDHLSVSVQRDLVVQFTVPAGRHLYAKPAPEGMIAVAVELEDDKNLVVRPTVASMSESHTMAVTNESFMVHNGVVELRTPLTVCVLVLDDREIEPQRVAGVIKWQMCDDEVCDIPQHQSFELLIPVSKVAVPDMRPKSTDAGEEKSQTAKHFEQMMTRHSKTD